MIVTRIVRIEVKLEVPDWLDEDKNDEELCKEARIVARAGGGTVLDVERE
jgi:hypothetical protein